MKNRIAFIAVFLFATLCVSGCTVTKNNQVTPSITTAPTKPVESTEEADLTETDDSEKTLSESLGAELLGTTPLGMKLFKNTKEGIRTEYMFINNKEGWKAVYEAGGMSMEDITLYNTLDGGINWAKVTSSLDQNDTIPNHTKSGMIFIDSMNGWVTVQIPQPGYIGLYETLNGGTTWQEQSITVPDEYADAEFDTYPPVFFTLKDGLLLADVGDQSLLPLVYATHDGGSTWIEVSEAQDVMFQWSYQAPQSGSAAQGWNIKYDGANWTTENGITWTK